MGTSIIPPKHLNDRRSLGSSSNRKYRAVSELKKPFFTNKPSKEQSDAAGNNFFSSQLKQKTDFSSHHQSAQPVTSRTPQNKTNMGEYEARNTTSLENISVLVQPSKSKEEDAQFFDDYASSVWKNLSSEAKGHFKNADEKRKKSIRENSSIQTYIVSQKDAIKLPNQSFCNNQSKLEEFKEKRLFLQKEDENLITQQAEIDSYGLSVNSKITTKETRQNTREYKNEELIKKIVRKRILLPQVQIVNGVKHKKKLKKLYDNNEIPNIHKRFVSTVS